MMTDYLQEIFDYLTHDGGTVFPVASNKVPWVSWKIEPIEASADPDRLREWFVPGVNGRYGPEGKWWELPLVGRRELEDEVTLDVDTKGVNGFDSLSRLIAPHDEVWDAIRNTLVIQTRSGGMHAKFRNPKGHQFKNTSKAFGPNYLGLDLRTSQGMLIIPPSPGYSYYQKNKRIDVPDVLAELHHDLYQPATTPTPSEPGESASISAGGRNDYLFHKACSLWGQGYPPEGITAMMTIVNDLVCNPPIDAKELKRTLESVFKLTPPEIKRAQDKHFKQEVAQSLRNLGAKNGN